MKKNYLLFFVLLCFVGFSSVAFAQEDRCPNGSYTAGVAQGVGTDLLVSDWEVEPSSPEHAFIILGSEVDEAGDRLIKGISYDGTFDFSNMADDDYCFVGFSYSQEELNDFVNGANPLICILFGGEGGALEQFCNEAENRSAPVPLPAELDVVLNVVGSAFEGLTVPSVEVAMDTVSLLVPAAPYLCYDIAEEEHCATVVGGVVTAVDGGVGIEELDANRFELIQNYPNPFSGYTNIAFSTPNASTVTFEVYDLTGRQLFSDQLNTRQGVNEYIFEAGDFSSGVYFYTITDGDDVLTGKMNVK